MKDKEIDDILKKAAETPHRVDPALLDRVTASLGASLGPVRPLPPPWILATGAILVCAAIALAGAARLGLSGFRELSGLQRVLIFPALAIQIGLAATVCVRERIPGSRRAVAPGLLLAACCVSLLAVFAVLFHDYATERFVHQGVTCLVAGLLHAVPAALAIALLLRRGFAVNPVAAGLAAGTLAGLAGLGMLELHCANFEAPHLMLWHTAVVPVAAAAGALLASFVRSLRPSRALL